MLSVLGAAALASGCDAVFGIQPGIPAAAGGGGTGGGGAGGTGGGGAGPGGGSTGGGGGGVCPPEKPSECDPALLTDSENCCTPGRSCQGGECVGGVCRATVLAPSGANEEGIALVVSGDLVMWSSGYGQSIYQTDLDGNDQVLVVAANQTDFNYVTMLAADPDPAGGYVFFTDYAGARIGRASIETGQPVVLAQVPEALAPGAQSGFGRILVHGDHVYWAMDFQVTSAGSSHIWRAPREPATLPAEAELVAMNDGAFGLAGDEDYLYFGDSAAHTIERLAWSEIGKKDGSGAPVLGEPEIMAAEQQAIGDVAVDDEYLYWARYNGVWAQKKGAPNGLLAPVTEVESYVWGIVSDGRDVYFSSVGDSDQVTGALYRMPRATSAVPEKVYQPDPPQGAEQARGISAVAEDCDTVYFLVQQTGLAQKATK